MATETAWQYPPKPFILTGMPGKGMFTQGVSLLLRETISLGDLRGLLKKFRIAGNKSAAMPEACKLEGSHFGTESLVLEFRPKVNGYVYIDLLKEKWPDAMGDPNAGEYERSVFAAWVAGAFGPFAYPQNLLRAAEQDWEWGNARKAAEEHKAFLRIRSSYIFGTPDDAPAFPNDYDSVAELIFVTKIAVALLEHPAVLCYFNPNGEMLLNKDSLVEQLSWHEKQRLPPLGIWSNVRRYSTQQGWMLLSTVGMGQLDFEDCEAWFPAESYNVDDVVLFLRNCLFFLLDKGAVIDDGHTMDGPGGVRWKAHAVKTKLDPPREVLRWFPMDGSVPPGDLDL